MVENRKEKKERANKKRVMYCKMVLKIYGQHLSDTHDFARSHGAMQDFVTNLIKERPTEANLIKDGLKMAAITAANRLKAEVT